MQIFWRFIIPILIISGIPGVQLFAQNGLHLWGQLDQKHGTTSGVSYSGLWGYVAPDGREYAILGTATGTQIIDITKQDSIREITHITGPTSIWREMRTWQQRAYVVSEGGSGVQIIDLSNLPAGASLIRSFNHTSGARNIIRNHTIEIFDGYMYLNGSANWSPGGVLIFSLANPDTPVFIGEYQQEYAHDSYVKGNRLYSAAINSGGLNIADISNKSAPAHVGKITYTGGGTHNAWTTTDGRFVFTTDEIGSTPKNLKIWDVTTIPPVPTATAATYAFTPNDIIHNVTVRGKYAYIAWYTAGTVVVDVRAPRSPVTAGFYDSSVETPGNYDGVWAVYPYFWSGKIIGGDMQNGLYVFTFDSLAARTPASLLEPSDGSEVCDASSVQFRWSRVADPIADPHSYRVTVSGPGLDSTFQTETDTSFTYSGIMADGLYRWFVTTVDEATMIATRDTFSFNKTSRSLGLTFPDGGNLLKAGAEAFISWNQSCNDSLHIEYSTDNGGIWQYITTVPAFPPSYTWTVPHTVTTLGLVRIASSQDSAFVDASSSTFEIFESPSLQIASPAAGMVWISGTTQSITWSHAIVNDIAIDYSTDNGGSWTGIVADTPAAIGSYDWLVPETGTPEARVRIRSTGDSTVNSVSAAFQLPLISLNFSGGWNLASFPARPLIPATLGNFTGATTTSIYYDAGYRSVDSILNGSGFWIKFASSDSEYVYGNPADQETVAVHERWNILGSLLDPIPVTGVLTDPPLMSLAGFFGYDPQSGFQISDTLYPGKGYWVKTSSSGKVILSSTPVLQSVFASARATVDQLDRFIITDAAGRRQILYAENASAGERDGLPGELPPAMNGMFDARFGSNRIIARSGHHGPEDRLILQSAVFPVSIKLDFSMRSYDLTESRPGNESVVHSLAPGGSVILQNSPVGSLDIRLSSPKSEGPASFALYQNYPNPFNPITTIRYDVPAESFVTLKVFNVLGQEVATLAEGIQSPGRKSVHFEADELPNGTYLLRLSAGGWTELRKMVLMK